MRTAEEILKRMFLKQIDCEHNKYVAAEFDEGVKSGRYKYAISAINEARIEAIKECGKIIDEYKSIYTAGDRPIKTEIQVEILKKIDQVK